MTHPEHPERTRARFFFSFAPFSKWLRLPHLNFGQLARTPDADAPRAADDAASGVPTLFRLRLMPTHRRGVRREA